MVQSSVCMREQNVSDTFRLEMVLFAISDIQPAIESIMSTAQCKSVFAYA
jgi:hypothetical protein